MLRLLSLAWVMIGLFVRLSLVLVWKIEEFQWHIGRLISVWSAVYSYFLDLWKGSGKKWKSEI